MSNLEKNLPLQREEKAQKTPAPNGRFGASGGVTRPTVCSDTQRFVPVRVAVKTPPALSRFYVCFVVFNTLKNKHYK